MSQEVKFLQDCSKEEIMRLLTEELAPVCDKCKRRKLYICVEKNCQGTGALCWTCDRGKHFTHRINEILLLFFNSKERRSFMETNRDHESIVFKGLMEAKCYIDDQIAQLERVSDACIRAINEAQRIMDHGNKYVWTDELNSIVAEALVAEKICPSRSEHFNEVLKKIHLYPERKLLGNPIINEFIHMHQIARKQGIHTTSSVQVVSTISQTVNVYQTLQTLENFIVEFHLGRWLREKEPIYQRFNLEHQSRPPYILGEELDSSYRSRILSDVTRHNSDRIVLDRATTGIALRERLTELVVRSGDVKIPKTLISLSYWDDWGSRPRGARNKTLNLPASLRCLRISFEQAKSQNLFTKLDEFPHLFYLVLGGPIDRAQLSGVAQRLREHGNFRVFTVISPGRLERKENYIRTVFEDQYAHQEVGLKRSYLSYRRTMLLIMMLLRTYKITSGGMDLALELLYRSPDELTTVPPLMPQRGLPL